MTGVYSTATAMATGERARRYKAWFRFLVMGTHDGETTQATNFMPTASGATRARDG